MSELSVGSLSGLAANSYVIDVASGSLLTQPGMILQVVRATDGTDRTTTSTSFTDVTGMSVTITPQKSNSRLLIIMVASIDTSGISITEMHGTVQIANSSNVGISGAESTQIGTEQASQSGNRFIPVFLAGEVSTGATSAVTYKARFRVATASCTMRFRNASSLGQMFAIEIGA